MLIIGALVQNWWCNCKLSWLVHWCMMTVHSLLISNVLMHDCWWLECTNAGMINCTWLMHSFRTCSLTGQISSPPGLSFPAYRGRIEWPCLVSPSPRHLDGRNKKYTELGNVIEVLHVKCKYSTSLMKYNLKTIKLANTIRYSIDVIVNARN